jgi:ribose 5-phosphate isomerase A
VIADFHGPMRDPESLAAWLKTVPGVVEHGLFRPQLVTEAFVARGSSVENIKFA